MKNDLIKRNGKIISKKMSNRMKNRLSGGFISRLLYSMIKLLQKNII